MKLLINCLTEKKQETPPDTENEQSPDDVENPDVQQVQTNIKQTGLASEDGYTKISIPWSLSINYSVRFGNTNVFNKEDGIRNGFYAQF